MLDQKRMSKTFIRLKILTLSGTSRIIVKRNIIPRIAKSLRIWLGKILTHEVLTSKTFIDNFYYFQQTKRQTLYYREQTKC